MSNKRIFIVRDETQETSPDLIIGYQAARTPRTIVHELIGGVTDASLIPAQLRSGTLGLFYLDKAAAEDALALLSRPEVFGLRTEFVTNPVYDIPFFVVTEDLSIELDESTRRRWFVSVTYQELAAG